MKNRILKILSSLLLISSISLNFTGCNSNSITEQTEQDRSSRKPQVSVNVDKNKTDDTQSEKENIYKDGEIVTLADGSKLKYDENGNHEILETGEGKILIFKNITDSDLDKLSADQRTMVERQMKSDPNGFALIFETSEN